MSLPKTQYAIVAENTSDSTDVLEYKQIDTPQIEGENDIIIKNRYAGVNFIDVYFRIGRYPSASLPILFGREASGEVVAIGSAVKDYAVGDKVFYFSPRTFAQYTKIDYSNHHYIHKLPRDTSDEDLKLFGSIIIQGLTAISFIEEFKVSKGSYVAVWAAAGGTGQILTQYAKSRGGRVIAIASSDEKLKISKELGAEFLVNSSTDNIPEKINEFTGGHGTDFIFDGVGKDAWQTNLEIAAKKGTVIVFGHASGLADPFGIKALSPKNLVVASPTVFGYINTKEGWDHYVKILEDGVLNGSIKFSLSTYALKDYPQATSALESRKTTGKLVLEIPQ